MQTETEIRQKIEKINAKIQFQLEMLNGVIRNLDEMKNYPESIINQKYSWTIGNIETDLYRLITAKEELESIING